VRLRGALGWHHADLDARVQMLIAEARVETERPSRYLAQVCRHVSELAQANRIKAQVEWSDRQGVIDFGRGRCSLQADPGVLTVRAEAPEEEGLLRIQERVTDRLELFGRRDGLRVTWTQLPGASEPHSGRPPSHDQGGGAHV
jgi:hypothetical protein